MKDFFLKVWVQTVGVHYTQQNMVSVQGWVWQIHKKSVGTGVPPEAAVPLAAPQLFLSVERSGISKVKPWPVWLSGLGIIQQTKRLPGPFLVRAHAWVMGQVPGGDVQEATNRSFSSSFPLSSPSVKINK